MLTYRRNPAVIETDLPDELILLDPVTREMFSLNATGRIVWQALAEGARGRELAIERIAAAFEVDPEVAGSDVDTLIARLAASGLVDRASEDAGPVTNASSEGGVAGG